MIVSVDGQRSSNLLATASSLEQKKLYARAMIESGLLPTNLATIGQLEDEESARRAVGAVISVVEFGAEMGINPWVAIQNIHNIKGKPTAGIHIFTGVAQANGIMIDVVEDFVAVKNDAGEFITFKTTVEITRKYDKLNTVKTHRFSKTWKEVELEGLANKDNYEKRPKTMLRTRAIVSALRLYAANYFLGLYETSEMADVAGMQYNVDDEGNVSYNQ